ncbi:MAG TPA: hypothetical protein VNM92_18540 [Thermoanaerobaculia bacterium]|nr:hypothetical protein [Thermoanaerobaculia bacterium]
MGCSDPLLLQRLMDGDLDDAQAELIAHHVEACAHCSEATNNEAVLRSFVQDQLGVEDDGEQDAAAATLARIWLNLGTLQPARPGASAGWRPAWLATAAIALLVLLLPLLFVSSVSAWPARILADVATRERMWLYQPNKVLHWEIETVFRGIKNTVDGRSLTVFWQNNGDKTFLQVRRHFNSQGQTESGHWQQADGSTISYRSQDEGVIKVSPSTAAAREALLTLAPEERLALESVLAQRQTVRSLDFSRHGDADWLRRLSLWTSESSATVRRHLLDRWGEVSHITVTTKGSPLDPLIVRAVHQYEIESSTSRLLRLTTTITYADGTVGVQDARWIVFREASEAEFYAQSPLDLINKQMRVVRMTPSEVARKELQKLHPAASH